MKTINLLRKFKNSSNDDKKRLFNVKQLNELLKYKNLKNYSKLNKINKIILLNNSLKTKKELTKTNVTKKEFLQKLTKKLVNNQEKPTNEEKYKNEIIEKVLSISNDQIRYLKIDLRLLKTNDLVDIIKNYYVNPDKKRLVIKINDKTYTLTDSFIDRLDDKTIDVVTYYIAPGSDNELLYELSRVPYVELELIEKETQRKEGAFFPYYHNLVNLDLTKYGLYNKSQIKNYSDNCLYNALKNGGMNNNKLMKLKLIIRGKYIAISSLKNICEKLDIKIILNRLKDNNNKHQNKVVYGLNDNEIYNIGLFESHYFIIDETNITSYSLKNYNNIKHINNYNKIFILKKGVYEKSNKNFINSFKLFSLLLKYKDQLLEKIPYKDLENTIFKPETINFDNVELKIDNSDLEKFNYKEHNNNKYESHYKVFFDFETWTDKQDNNKHKPYLVCFHTIDNIKKVFYGEDSGNKMLDYLVNTLKKDKILLIAHNAKYDYNFISSYLYNENIIFKDNQFYQSTASYFTKTKIKNEIIIKDSYKLISSPLKKFNKIFKLGDVEKEIMPYDLYNLNNPLINRMRTKEECLSFLNEKDHKHFINNIKKWNCLINNKVDIIKYSKIYCLIDCEVLKNGYEIFKKWMLELTNLNIDSIVTIASLSHKYMLKTEVFDNCFSLSGMVQKYIMNTVVGGRVMTNQNKKINASNVTLADFDACSLYPSAMYRLPGYLQGTPKVLLKDQLNKNFLDSTDGYFIRCKITKLNKKRDFPLISILKNGVREFTNDVDNHIIYFNKFSFEDAIAYHDIEYEILDGVYFNEGRNNKIKNVIKYLYDERRKKKQEKNPIQECYKLIMNSSYGKTIQKENDSKLQIINGKDKKINHINYHYNSIKQLTKIGKNKYLSELYNDLSDHFNYCHIGSEILSMSKRIMNEVMCLCEDNNIKIYYQDTDSMHIEYDEVEKLGILFKNYYKRDLIGNYLGQFHIDFSLDDCLADSIKSINSFFLGKKCYIDELVGYNREGIKKHGYHIRMKGISNDSIYYTCEKLKITPLVLYKKLYNGETINFDLLCGGSKCSFQFNKLSYVSSRSSFNRNIKF